MKRRESLLVLLVSIAAFSACSVGPDFESPVLEQLPASFTVEQADTPSGQPAELADWWQSFDDPNLTGLVEQAVRNNYRITIASARIDEARAIRRARGGRLLPSVSSTLSGGRTKASAAGPGPLAGLAEAGLASLENEQYDFAFESAWELDLFGKLRRAREASDARLEGAIEIRRAVLLGVAAETASAYVDLRGAERRIELAERNLDLQRESLAVIDGKVEAGLLSQLDLERLRSQVETTRASIPPLRAQKAAARHRLAVLLGRAPGSRERLELLEERSTVPVPPRAIATGLPADLLLRRPDLRLAERDLQAATADIGVAVGERYPSVSLGGAKGLQNASLSDLLESAGRTWNFGVNIGLPIFQGGQLAAAVEAARARLDVADAQWRQSVLLSLEEVETVLVGLEQSWNRLAALEQATDAARHAAESAGVLFDEGLRDSLTLLDAQRSLTLLEDAEALAQIARAQQAIALYRALGGGWTVLEEWLPATVGRPRSEPASASSED